MMSELEVLSLVSFKMFYAVVCGAVVGIERKLNDASAGFKTQILVCVGSMLFTVVPAAMSGKLDGDGLRIVAQIVSGVGFLGAGAILHGSSHHVVGLTTAAWIWFTAANRGAHRNRSWAHRRIYNRDSCWSYFLRPKVGTEVIFILLEPASGARSRFGKEQK